MSTQLSEATSRGPWPSSAGRRYPGDLGEAPGAVAPWVARSRDRRRAVEGRRKIAPDRPRHCHGGLAGRVRGPFASRQTLARSEIVPIGGRL